MLVKSHRKKNTTLTNVHESTHNWKLGSIISPLYHLYLKQPGFVFMAQVVFAVDESLPKNTPEK